jgi:hypothetical protein
VGCKVWGVRCLVCLLKLTALGFQKDVDLLDLYRGTSLIRNSPSPLGPT